MQIFRPLLHDLSIRQRRDWHAIVRSEIRSESIPIEIVPSDTFYCRRVSLNRFCSLAVMRSKSVRRHVLSKSKDGTSLYPFPGLQSSFVWVLVSCIQSRTLHSSYRVHPGLQHRIEPADESEHALTTWNYGDRLAGLLTLREWQVSQARLALWRRKLGWLGF